MSSERREPAVVFLDALGTLLELQPPGPRLRRLLATSGFELDEERAVAGFATEISYYLEHHLEGADRERLEDLRDRCATVLMEALDLPGLDHATARRAMLGALELIPYPDAQAALERLRWLGHTLVVVSNWDCSLPDWLARAGLLELVDGVVTSADVGVAKPSRVVFERALAVAGGRPEHAAHVGDSLDKDISGAQALGIRPILMRREGELPHEVEAVRSLAELPGLL